MPHAQVGQSLVVVSQFVDSLQEPRTPYISPARFSKVLGVKTVNLAELNGVHRNTLRNPSSERLQVRMREMVKVISAVAQLTGTSKKQSIGTETNRSSTMVSEPLPNLLLRATLMPF